MHQVYRAAGIWRQDFVVLGLRVSAATKVLVDLLSDIRMVRMHAGPFTNHVGGDETRIVNATFFALTFPDAIYPSA